MQSLKTEMEIGVTCYKIWLSMVSLLGGAVGEAVSLEGAFTIGMCSSGPV